MNTASVAGMKLRYCTVSDKGGLTSSAVLKSRWDGLPALEGGEAEQH